MSNDEVLHDDHHPLWTPTIRRRLAMVLIGALVVVLLIVLPPYISVSRYQRRVSSALSEALGRPVRIDNIQLHVLPLPGFGVNVGARQCYFRITMPLRPPRSLTSTRVPLPTSSGSMCS